MWESICLSMHHVPMHIICAYILSHGSPAKWAEVMHLTVNSKSNLMLFTSLGFIHTHNQMAEEVSKLWGLEARVAALKTKFNFLLQFIRRMTKREEEKKKATISKRQKEIYPALSLSKAAQTLPTPRRPAFHIPRPSRTEPRQFQPLPIPVPQLYTLRVKKKMITPVCPRTRIEP